VNTTEDRLRDAYHAAANTVHPDSLPGLGTQVVRVPRRPRSRRLQFALPAVAAAATCALIVAATILVPHAAARHTTTVPARPAASARSASASALPPYTVVSQGAGDSLMVYDTASGAVTGTMDSPSGQQFVDVAADGNDRSFLVSTSLDSPAACAATFYKLQLAEGGQPLSLTPLRTVAGSTPTAVAADGSTFAYSVAHCATNSSGRQTSNTVTGYIGAGNRHWTFTLSEDYANSLAVSASAGKLAFPMFVPGGGLIQAGLVLDTGSRSATVAGASRVTLHGHGTVQSVAISANGGTLYACTQQGTTMTIAAYDTATGTRTRLLHDWRVPQRTTTICDLSTDASAGYLLASVSTTGAATDTSVGQSAITVTGYRLSTATTITLPSQLASGSGWNSTAW